MRVDGDVTTTGADAFIERLTQLGIDTIYANAGTDFPPVIEALSKSAALGKPIQAIAVPHENLAVCMAYGHYLVSGKPQVVMLHVNVGTANAVCALMNAFRERIPLIVAAGRTPYTEAGHPASRSMFIHWAQEMFDQASLVRETVKWDYEVKIPEQVRPAVDRSFSLAMSEPRGPVYLTLPREMLATGLAANAPDGPPQPPTQRMIAEDTSLEQAATLLVRAQRPLIVTASLGQNPKAVEALASLAHTFAIPVVSHVPKSLCLPTDHPMHMGYAPSGFVARADAIVVLECDVPWFPNAVSPNKDAKVIHIGMDPLFGRYGIRNFPCDLALAGDPELTLSALHSMIARQEVPVETIAVRRAEAERYRAARRARLDAVYEQVKDEEPIHPTALTREIDRIKEPDTVLVNELGIQIDHITLTKPGTYFQQSSAGGLGWGLGAALGIKLAAPDRFVIAVVGDGSYMFGNPTPAHFVSRALGLPILFIVTNNAGWASVRGETQALYPNGYSQAANDIPLTSLQPAPHFERVVEASDGLGIRVERIADLRPALERAAHAVKVEKRQALVNVLCRML